MVVLVAWFAIVGALVLYRFVVRAYLPVAPADLDAFATLYHAPSTDPAHRLYGAYLSRARRYRSTWSAVGWSSAFVLAWQFRVAHVGFGPGTHPLYTDLLFMGFGGYLLGAIVAELHHLRGRAAGVRTVSLVRRDPSAYVRMRTRMLFRVVVTASVLVCAGYCVLDAAGRGTGGFSWAVVGDGVVVVAVWLVIELAQRAVVLRARPALPDDLALGDDAIRSAAAETLLTGGAGFVLLVTAWMAFTASNHLDGSWVFNSGWTAILSLIFALRLAFKTRRLAWPSRKIAVEGVRA